MREDRRHAVSVAVWLVLLLSLSSHVFASPDPLQERRSGLIGALQHLRGMAGKVAAGHAPHIEVRGCDRYPDGHVQHDVDPAQLLLDELAGGLDTGLACLSGQGPMGRLHPYHEYQAHRLLSLFESTRAKTFHCVDDSMFATAVATPPGGTHIDDPLYQQLRQVRFPAVILDTYRLGGLLSRRLDDRAYRDFFHLAEDQIFEHRNGQPLRLPSLHRYRDRRALLFHEVVHWLGHEHSAVRPDLAHLYETCCFGGSDYIHDDALNRRYQRQACDILADDELWSVAYNPYRQMRVWHHKAYDRLKPDMRADYTD